MHQILLVLFWWVSQFTHYATSSIYSCENSNGKLVFTLQIRLQLESLLAEKARLAQENSVYSRENRFLREIVEYHQLTMQDVVYIDENNEELSQVYPINNLSTHNLQSIVIPTLPPSLWPIPLTTSSTTSQDSFYVNSLFLHRFVSLFLSLRCLAFCAFDRKIKDVVWKVFFYQILNCAK